MRDPEVRTVSKRRWRRFAIIVSMLFAVELIWHHNPWIPLSDDGHACYEMQDENAAKTLLKVMALGSLAEDFTFDSGPTHQTVLSDRKTVLLWLDNSEKLAGGSGNARSLVVGNPRKTARAAAKILTEAGYTAEVREPPMGELGENKLVLLKTNALASGCLVFRRHALMMGKPPVKRYIGE